MVAQLQLKIVTILSKYKSLEILNDLEINNLGQFFCSITILHPPLLS